MKMLVNAEDIELVTEVVFRDFTRRSAAIKIAIRRAIRQ
jgi:hypothetical protein